MTLMSVILSVSLFNYNRFGKETELENSGYSIALAVRETQVFGINRKLRAEDTDPQVFGEDYGYGVHFRKIGNPLPGSVATVDGNHFAFFTDSTGGDKKMTGSCSGVEECQRVITINKGNYISDIKVRGALTWIGVGEVDIYFKRPNPDATITSGSTEYSRAQIIISDPGNEYHRCVEVGVAGDMTIKRARINGSSYECFI